jgi:hypothetical protein
MLSAAVKRPPHVSRVPPSAVEKERREASAANDVEKPPQQQSILPAIHGGQAKPRSAAKATVIAPMRRKSIHRFIKGGQTLRECAATVVNARQDEREERVNDLVWCLIREKRFGLAYHLARYLEETAGMSDVPSALLDALVVAPRLNSSIGSIADRLHDDFQIVQTAWAMDSNLTPQKDVVADSLSPETLLTFASALWPTLLAPGMGVQQLLRQLHFDLDLEILGRLRDFVVRPAEQNIVLTPTILKGNPESERWDRELQQLRERTTRWLSKNRVSTVIYQPTTCVWHRWLALEGPIGQMVGLVIADDRRGLADARKAIDYWKSGHHVDRELHRTDDELRGVGAKRRPIEARAVRAIRERCGEAVSRVQEWIDLLNSSPQETLDWVENVGNACRQNLLTAIPQCKTVIIAASEKEGVVLPMQAACAVMIRALDDLAMMLDPSIPLTDEEFRARQDLNGDLLAIDGLNLNDLWEPEEPHSPAILDGVVQLLLDKPRPWPEILRVRWQQNDFLAAERILELLDGLSSEAEEDVVALRQQHGQLLGEARRVLNDGVRHVFRQVQNARIKGLIDENDRLRLMAQLGAIRGEQSLRIHLDLATLDEIRRTLNRSKAERIDGFRQNLEQSRLAERNAEAYGRLEQLMEVEDLLTAHEYLAILDQGGQLPTPSQPPPGLDFFPKVFEELKDLFFGRSRQELRDIAKRFQRRESLGATDLSQRLTPGEATKAFEVLEAWRRLKNKQGEAGLSIKKVLEFIGFRIHTLQPYGAPGQNRAAWFELQADPLQQRDDCPLPDFGSRCKGRYLLVCLHDQPLEEQLLRDTKIEQRTQAVLALFFGPMSERRRRDLAHALRPYPTRRLLVLDDILLVYLCLQKRSRLLALFNAACAFSPAEPYTTTASQVPIEMFFGRKREIESVFEPDGTCLVYGGRQLGKTALLREVDRRYHYPKKGIVVRWIDLRHGEHIGQTRPLDDIWIVIASHLQPFGIITQATRKQQTIQQEVIQWLNVDSQRRIVLLLDEADEFLRQDGNEGWLRVGHLKTIMDQTERRFKVVFCGLHNVQRTSHDVNTPLAHLGKPVCVGPFLSNEEIRDAVEMVRNPFEAIGYRFQSPELIGRVLAQTNFYPSLIQLFCRQLLQHLTRGPDADMDRTNTPPYLIRLEDIDNASADKEVADEIRYRFRLTLNLDPRYRVIALSLALETLESPQTAVDGYSLEQIRNWAVSVWPKGFVESSSNDAFRSLLMEMAELGVLREVSAGHYAMRSPNVIGFLGTQEDILNGLVDAVKQGPPAEPDPESFRRVFNDESKWRRSPLTARQESLLFDPSRNGVFLIMGSPAAGLNEVLPFLDVLAGSFAAAGVQFERLCGPVDAAAFEAELSAVLDAREEGITVVLIDPCCPWDEKWVVQAGQAIRKRSGTKTRFAKVVFLVGPREAWRWAGLSGEVRDRLQELNVAEISLAPWSDIAVRAWKNEAEFGENTDEDSQRFREATGYWCCFLHALGRRCVECPHEWKMVVERFREEFFNDGEALRQFELVPESLPVLGILAQFLEGVTTQEVKELLDDNDVAVSFIERVVRWAQMLQIVSPAQHSGAWSLDPFLARLLAAGTTNAT